MKTSMSSADIKACVSELQSLIGGKIEKIYHHVPDEIRIKIYSKGRNDLILEAGKRIHLTKFPRESPRFPSSFAMLMRKHLEGGRVKSIEQYDFDRVVLMEVEKRETNYYIIAEFFSKGNVILANSEKRIIMPLKSGIFTAGDKYKFPEQKTTPYELTKDKLRELFKEQNKEVVKVLAINGLGGLYAEEVCKRAEINKKVKAKDLKEEEIERIYHSIKDVFSNLEEGKLRPHIVLKNGEYFDVLPIELRIYDEYEKKYFNTFNEALDEYYSKLIVEKSKKEERNPEIEKLKSRLEKQLEKLNEFNRELELYRKMGDTVYENWKKLEALHSAFVKALKTKTWEEIKKIVKDSELSKIVKDLKPERKSVVVNIDGIDLEIFLDKTLPQTADVYYEKAKKIKSKIEGLKKAIEKTKEDMKKAEELEAKKLSRSIRVVRKREWYEKFRWFVTSDGFIVIGGRTAKMNEEIVSKYMESKDLFFHTQTPGAPVTILKRGQEAPETSIIEAAQFAATYSSLWKEGKYSGDVYYVKPEQVKKAAKHGEYLSKGSFYIEGKREYLSVELSCAVGVELSKLRVFGGPLSSVKKYCDYYVELEIGDLPQNELSILIAKTLIKLSNDDHVVRSIASPDEIAKFLPPGKSRIKSVYPSIKY